MSIAALFVLETWYASPLLQTRSHVLWRFAEELERENIAPLGKSMWSISIVLCIYEMHSLLTSSHEEARSIVFRESKCLCGAFCMAPVLFHLSH